MSGIRAEPRTAILARGEVSWEDQNGTTHDAPTRIEDRSPSGACIRVKVPISVGSTVRIKSQWEGFSGITRYCRKDQDEYLLGIQRFAKDMQSSALRTEPVREGPATRVAPPKIDEVTNPGSEPATAPVPSAPVLVGVAKIDLVEKSNSKEFSREPHDTAPDNSAGSAPQAKSPSPDKGRTQMSTKWLDAALGRQKQGAPNGNAHGASVPGSHPPEEATASEKIHGSAIDTGSSKSHGDLQTMEDIYRAAGIMNPRMGYSITKVVEMLNSEHIRGLPIEAKRAAVLMALDAAGVSIKEVLRDATLRQEALDKYENDQRKHFEDYWARKIESNTQIQAELDRVSAEFQERINRNLDEVKQEKSAFTRWQALKEQEAERMTEAIGLCSKSPDSEPTAGSVPALREVGTIVKSQQ